MNLQKSVLLEILHRKTTLLCYKRMYDVLPRGLVYQWIMNRNYVRLSVRKFVIQVYTSSYISIFSFFFLRIFHFTNWNSSIYCDWYIAYLSAADISKISLPQTNLYTTDRIVCNIQDFASKLHSCDRNLNANSSDKQVEMLFQFLNNFSIINSF